MAKLGRGVQRTAGQAAVHYGGGAEAVRAVRRGGAKRLLHRGKAAVAGLGGSVAGAGAPGRENPLGGAAGEPAVRRGDHAFGGAAPEHGAGHAGRGAACRAGAGRARLCA